VIGAHFTEDYPDQASGRTASHRMRMARRIGFLPGPRLCESCKAWHVVVVDNLVTTADRTVLRNVALGFSGPKIWAKAPGT
jgi:hypothetical protein